MSSFRMNSALNSINSKSLLSWRHRRVQTISIYPVCSFWCECCNVMFCIQTMQVSKLLYFINSLSTATGEPAVAKPELLANTNGLTKYYEKLSGPEVSLKRFHYLHILIVFILCSFVSFHALLSSLVLLCFYYVRLSDSKTTHNGGDHYRRLIVFVIDNIRLLCLYCILYVFIISFPGYYPRLVRRCNPVHIKLHLMYIWP